MVAVASGSLFADVAFRFTTKENQVMTNRTLCKTVLTALCALTFLASGYSQSNPTQATSRDASVNATALTKLIESNVAEVEMGKIATSKATNPRVKEFAEMMVKDHTQALDKLQALSGAPSDVKPNAKQKLIAERLSKLSGAEFDREYMKAMVTEHQEDVRFLEQHSRGAKHPNAGGSTTADLSSVAKELLPTVQRHLQMAQEIQKELGSKQTSSPSSKPSSDQRSKPTPGPYSK
jgi:putative membrane protein